MKSINLLGSWIRPLLGALIPAAIFTETPIGVLQARAYEIAEKGTVDPKAKSLIKKAALLIKEGNYKEATNIWAELLNYSIKKSGIDHPDTATAGNNLAELYRMQGLYEKAEPLYQRSLVQEITRTRSFTYGHSHNRIG